MYSSAPSRFRRRCRRQGAQSRLIGDTVCQSIKRPSPNIVRDTQTSTHKDRLVPPRVAGRRTNATADTRRGATPDDLETPPARIFDLRPFVPHGRDTRPAAFDNVRVYRKSSGLHRRGNKVSRRDQASGQTNQQAASHVTCRRDAQWPADAPLSCHRFVPPLRISNVYDATSIHHHSQWGHVRPRFDLLLADSTKPTAHASARKP